MSLTLVTDGYALAAQEDRCAERIKLELPGMLRPSGSTAFATTVIDLSISGFSARAVTGMHSGTLCWLSVGACKGLQAQVVWNDGATVGCAFANLLNPAILDSITSGR